MKYDSKFPIVLIEWEDSCSWSSEWIFTKNLQKIYENVYCWTVGWILNEDQETIVITQTLGDIHKENEQFTGVIQIPKSAIRKIIKIKEKVNASKQT